MTNAAPGWYPDHTDSEFVRYWDGKQWTEHMHPAVSSGADLKAQAKDRQRLKRESRESERTERRAQARADKQTDKRAWEAHELKQLGRQVAAEPFGGRKIRIYERGFVKVGAIIGHGSGVAQRLISIEASADVGKKSGLGRGAAAVMTGGLNLLGSSKRGDVYLTIVTDEQTYALRESPPTAGNMTRSKKLEGAGNGVLGAASIGSAGDSPPTTVTPGVRERLSELKSLLEEGLINQEDYDTKRKSLLEDL